MNSESVPTEKVSLGKRSNSKNSTKSSESSSPISTRSPRKMPQRDLKSSPALLSHIKRRLKKRVIDGRDIRTGGKFAWNDFVERKSLLDLLHDSSQIAKSPFRGILLFCLTFNLVWVLNSIASNYKLLASQLTVDRLFTVYFNEMKHAIVYWVLAATGTLFVFAYQKLCVQGVITGSAANWLSFVTEYAIALYISYHIYWCQHMASTRLFMICQTLICFFKANSYSKANRVFREQKEYLRKARGRVLQEDLPAHLAVSPIEMNTYPNNVNLENFVMFLIYPTLVY